MNHHTYAAWAYIPLAGVLLGIGFVMVPLWPLVFAGFALLMYRITCAVSLREAYFTGLLIGFFFYGLALYASWWHTLPLDWLGLESRSIGYLLVAFSWLVTVLGFSLWTGFFALAYKSVSDGSWKDFVLVPSLLIVCEWAGSLWFGIQNFGPGMLSGAHYTLPFIGNLLANNTTFLQIAWLGGVYALSAFIAFVGVALHRLAVNREKWVSLTVLIVVVLAWIGGSLVLRSTSSATEKEKPFQVSALSLQRDPTIVPSQKSQQDNLESVLRLLPDTADAALVVLPEGTNVLRMLRSDKNPEEILSRIYTDTSPVLVDSESSRDTRGVLKARMEYYQFAQAQSDYREKQFLLPIGEYMPVLYLAVLRSWGLQSKLQYMLSSRGYTPGGRSAPVTVSGVSVGGLFCDESLSPELYRDLAAQGSQTFINVASHSWYHGSRVVAMEIENIAKVRAVESRRWYVQASNMAPSFVLDPYGREVMRTQDGEEQVLNAVVFARDDTTPYMRFGPYIPYMSVFLYTVLALRRYLVGRA